MKKVSTKTSARKSAAPKLSDRKSLALVRKLTGEGSPLDDEARGWLDGVTAELIEETGAIRDDDLMRRAYADAARVADGWKAETKADSPHSYVPLAAVVSRVSAGEDAAEVVRELIAAERQRQVADARPLDELKARAEAVVRNPRGFDADTRHHLDLTLHNLRDGHHPARDEQTLREQIRRVERGESLSDLSDVEPKAAKAARAFLAVLDIGGVPDFAFNSMTQILDTLAAATGAHLFRWPKYGEDIDPNECGDYSLEILARIFANPPQITPRLMPELDLAGLVSAVLRHPDTPTPMRDAVLESFGAITYDDTAPEYVRGLLASREREGNVK